jgi:hypothetical protein
LRVLPPSTSPTLFPPSCFLAPDAGTEMCPLQSPCCLLCPHASYCSYSPQSACFPYPYPCCIVLTLVLIRGRAQLRLSSAVQVADEIAEAGRCARHSMV